MLLTVPTPSALHRWSRPWPGVVAGGVLLGVGDLAAQRVVPYPWADLANSAAVWAVAAAVVGALVGAGGRLGRARPAVAGVLALAVATEAYYAAGVLGFGDDPSTLVSPVAAFWLVGAVGAGVVFGTAGAWARGSAPVQAAVGVAVPAAVLLGEAVLRVWAAAGELDPLRRHDQVHTAVVEVVLAVLVVLVAGRGTSARLLGGALAVPLAVIGFLGFAAFGFGG